MMRAPNLIHGLTFDVAYDGAGQSSEALADWLRETLLPVVDETLAQHDQEHGVCRIERLEIDLGEILRDDAESELARRLHEQLAAALNWSPAAKPSQRGAVLSAVAGDDASATQLLNFLRTGQLPWSFASDQDGAHEHLLQRVLAFSDAKSVLTKAVQDPLMLTRLIRQFSGSTLAKVARLLHGSHVIVSENAGELHWQSLLSQTPPRSGAAQRYLRNGSDDIPVLPAQAARSATQGVSRAEAIVRAIETTATTVAALDQSLRDCNITEILRMLPEVVGPLRAEFTLLWQRLPAEIQQRNQQLLASHLDASDWAMLQDLIQHRGDRPQPEQAPNADAAAHADADSAPDPLSAARPAATSANHAVTELHRALSEGDIAELVHVWPYIVSTLQNEFKSIWQRLPAATQQRNRRHLAKRLKASDRLKMHALIQAAEGLRTQVVTSSVHPKTAHAGPTKGARPPITASDVEHMLRQQDNHKALASALTASQQRELAALIHEATFVAPAASNVSAPLELHEEALDVLSQALHQGDMTQVARIWPAITSTLRQEFTLLWQRLPQQRQQHNQQLLADLLDAAGWRELESLIPSSIQAQTRPDHAGSSVMNAGQKIVANMDGPQASHTDRAMPPIDKRTHAAAVLDLALWQSDVETLVRMWPEAIFELREQLKLSWLRLPASKQLRNQQLLASNLSEVEWHQLKSLMPSLLQAQPDPEGMREDSAWSSGMNAGQKAIANMDGPQTLNTVPAMPPTGKTAQAAATLDVALRQSDVETLVRMWPEIISELREELSVSWLRLPAERQQRNQQLLASRLSEVEWSQLESLMLTLPQIGRGLGVMRADGARSSGMNAGQKAIANMDDQQAPKAGPAMPPTDKIARAAAMLDAALRQSDVATLVRMWPEAISELREELRISWLRLPAETQQRNQQLLASHLNEIEWSQLESLMPSLRQTGQGSDVMRADGAWSSGMKAEQKAIANMDNPQASNTGLAMPPTDKIAHAAATLDLALRQSDVAALVRMWPEIISELREEWEVSWLRLRANTRKRNQQLLAVRLSEVEWRQFQLLIPAVGHELNPGGAQAGMIVEGVEHHAPDADIETGAPRSDEEFCLIGEAIRQGDVAQLRRMWGEVLSMQRDVFRQVWFSLPVETQQRNHVLFTSQLEADQLRQFQALISEGSQAASSVTTLAAPPAASSVVLLNQALHQGDADAVARMWPDIVANLRDEFRALWRHLSVDAQQRNQHRLAEHFRVDQWRQLLVLIQGDEAQTDISQATAMGALGEMNIEAPARQWTALMTARSQPPVSRNAQEARRQQLQALIQSAREQVHNEEYSTLVSAFARQAKGDLALNSSLAQFAELIELAGTVPNSGTQVKQGDRRATATVVNATTKTEPQRSNAVDRPIASVPSGAATAPSTKPEMPAIALEPAVASGPGSVSTSTAVARLAGVRLPAHATTPGAEAALAKVALDSGAGTSTSAARREDGALPAAAASRSSTTTSSSSVTTSPSLAAHTSAVPPAETPHGNPLEPLLLAEDIAALAYLWPTIVATRRAEFIALWHRQPEAVQQRSLQAFRHRLNPAQLVQLQDMISRVPQQPEDIAPAPRHTQTSADVQRTPPEEAMLMPEQPDQINSTISHARIDPALAMFRDWQRHKLELSSISLSLEELKQWLNWWLMHDARLVNQDCSLMLDAIESQCSQVQEPIAFMRLVLTALRAGDALDLEAMALQSRAPAAANEKPVAMDAIATLQSQQSIRNFIEQQMAEDPQLAGLNSAQLHQLVRAWIGETSALFLEAIEEQALQVRDVHAYFRSILQSLLLGQAVDLETFAAPAMLADTCEEAAPPIPHDAMPTQPEASPLPQPLQQTLPQRLADAFLRADLKPLEIIWPEIARFHPDVLLAAAKRYLRRPQEQAALVASAPPDMVLNMLAAIAPPVHRQIAPLVRNADECNAILPEPWTVHEFTQRILRFGLTRALDGATGAWLDGLLQALDVNRAWNNDVAHAWRAILPPSPALEHALFGDAQERAQLTAAMPWAGEDALAVLLLRSSPLSETERRLAGLLVERLLEGRKLSGAIESALCQPAAIARLTSMTSGPVLAQLLVLLQPTLAAQLPSVLKAIAGSVAVTNVPAMQTSRTWSVIYQSAFVAADPVTPTEFIRNLAHSASGRTDLALPSAVAGANRIETLLTLLRPMTLKESNPQPQQEQQAQQEQAWSSESHIRNAGMVIFATYMQRLFSILELTKDGKFVSDEAGERAVHLLQYAVNGESSTPEFQLVLNKLFCGIHGGVPMVRGIEMTQKEKEVIEQMLNGVIAHWSALGKTSISGLRQTFLQREGHLYFEEDAWHLRIPQATFDMLLDRLPWSFGMIKFPWMQHPLHVSWR